MQKFFRFDLKSNRFMFSNLNGRSGELNSDISKLSKTAIKKDIRKVEFIFNILHQILSHK